jgi:hypothetical protein
MQLGRGGSQAAVRGREAAASQTERWSRDAAQRRADEHASIRDHMWAIALHVIEI